MVDCKGEHEGNKIVGSGSNHSPGETTGKVDSAAESNTSGRERRGMTDISLDDLEEQDIKWWYYEKKHTDPTNIHQQQQKQIFRRRRDFDETHIFALTSPR